MQGGVGAFVGVLYACVCVCVSGGWLVACLSEIYLMHCMDLHAFLFRLISKFSLIRLWFVYRVTIELASK
jgi:hypothetical protein